MASRFRMNRYNWLAQKLLTRHQYDDIVKLNDYLLVDQGNQKKLSTTISEHLIYIHGLALMKTSTRLNEVINSLQHLNFHKNNQYFLLMCQCLFYLGNYDSVVELCKQVINKQIDAVSGDSQQERESNIGADERLGNKSTFNKQESFEFDRIFLNINRNNLINEPKLWFIFALCLEHQHQYKDAQLAYRIASKLSLGNQDCATNDTLVAPSDMAPAAMNNYYIPHIKYAEFCIKRIADFKSAVLVLGRASQMFPQTYAFEPLLALALSAQPTSNLNNFNKAIDIISSLEAYSASNRNPSSGYNSLTWKFRCQLRNSSDGLFLDTQFSETGDENRNNLNFLLIKGHVMINRIAQDLEHTMLKKNEASDYHLCLTNQVDKLIDSFKNSDPSCWASFSLWNNLGLCYLMKKKFIACISCLMKAYHINSTDWRVNFNIALACLHIGLVSRALLCLTAARNFYIASTKDFVQDGETCDDQVDPLITTLLAICYEKLNQTTEVRRLYLETTRFKKGSYGTSIISLVNYLVFLHKNSDSQDSQNVKLKLHLLDQLEQCWLQRNQNDPQFNSLLMNVARLIGEEISSDAVKKTYAWAKIDHSAGQ